MRRRYKSLVRLCGFRQLDMTYFRPTSRLISPVHRCRLTFPDAGVKRKPVEVLEQEQRIIMWVSRYLRSMFVRFGSRICDDNPTVFQIADVYRTTEEGQLLSLFNFFSKTTEQRACSCVPDPRVKNRADRSSLIMKSVLSLLSFQHNAVSRYVRLFKGVGSAWIVQPHMADHPGGETRNCSRFVPLSTVNCTIRVKSSAKKERGKVSSRVRLRYSCKYVVEDVRQTVPT